MSKIIRTDKWELMPNKYQLIFIVNNNWKEVAVAKAQQRCVEQLFHNGSLMVNYE